MSMTGYLWICMVISGILVIATLGFTIAKLHAVEKPYLGASGETLMTIVLGALLIALGYSLLLMKYIDPSMAAEQALDGYLFISAFSMLCILLGLFTIPFTLVKRCCFYQDRIVCISITGEKKEIQWKDLVTVKKNLSGSALKVGCADGTSFSVRCQSKGYKVFCELSKERARSLRN